MSKRRQLKITVVDKLEKCKNCIEGLWLFAHLIDNKPLILLKATIPDDRLVHVIKYSNCILLASKIFAVISRFFNVIAIQQIYHSDFHI